LINQFPVILKIVELNTSTCIWSRSLLFDSLMAIMHFLPPK